MRSALCSYFQGNLVFRNMSGPLLAPAVGALGVPGPLFEGQYSTDVTHVNKESLQMAAKVQILFAVNT